MTLWQGFVDAEAVSQEAADRIAAAAKQAIIEKGFFTLVLAGGTTPRRVYEMLCERQADRSAWHLFYGDERCLAVDDPQRNNQMVKATGLSEGVAQHWVMAAEEGAEAAADSYVACLPDGPFDLVLLGMGEDGHTASLFPGHQHPSAEVLAVHDSPKPPADRVSLSLSRLQNCQLMLLLVTGEAKRDALQAWRNGDDLPIARVAECAQASVLCEARLMTASGET